METPIFDFVRAYRDSGTARLHMPGHKGTGPLGCEALDITEIKGADALYEADGIIAESERNAASLFGTGRTLYSAEGSSQCIRAMLYTALALRRPGTAPVILAARNVHKAFVYGATLCGASAEWLYGTDRSSLMSCAVTPAELERALAALPEPPAAVYVTSPDYLGATADIAGLAAVCHRFGTLLAVDNAHGAYLHFLPVPAHPMDLGADICCDSAHKTLPVLTGGAYLHLSARLPALGDLPRRALALFGSTSPSYLILASLDRCNRTLAEEYPAALAETAGRIAAAKQTLTANGWRIVPSDPLRITVEAPDGLTGTDLAERLRRNGLECEHADGEHLVLMLTPYNPPEDLERLTAALGKNGRPCSPKPPLPDIRAERVLSLREAVFAPQETVPVGDACGRICASPAVSCPPAIPVVVSGERITPNAVSVMQHYGIGSVAVVKE